MRLLLDTHVLLWALAAPERLPAEVQRALEAPENIVCVSAASIWEIAIKRTLARSGFQADPDEIVCVLPEVGFLELPVQALHAARVADLPPVHRDPFDRLLVAQAMVEPLILVTRDRVLGGYPIQLWQIP